MTSNIVTKNRDIIKIFSDKFLISSNEQNKKDDESNLLSLLNNSWRNHEKFHLKISVYRLRKLIQRLNNGMGHDGIHAAFLKRASDAFLGIIVRIFNTFYNHCYISEGTLRGNVNPIIKDQKGNCTESSNYRPVMQSSCLLKLLEMHILDILEERLVFNARQFGFKKGTSTTDACYVLKET